MNRSGYALLLGGLLTISVLFGRTAESAEIDDRIDKLRSEVGVVPTNPGNIVERGYLLQEWMGRLVEKGVFIPPDGPSLAFKATAGDPNKNRGRFREVDWLMEVLVLQEKGQRALGSVSITPNKPVVAGSWGTWHLKLVVGEIPIPEGGLLGIGQRFQAKWGHLQCVRPAAANYVTTQTKADVELKGEMIAIRGIYGQMRNTIPRPFFRVTKGSLTEGDEVVFVLGDTSGGGRGAQVQPFSNDRSPFLVMATYTDSGPHVPLGEAYLEVTGAAANRLSGVLPSVAAPGSETALRVRVEDVMKNPAGGFSGEISALLDGAKVGATRVVGHSGEVELVLPAQQGVYTYELQGPNGLKGESNPVVVRADTSRNVYWGDFHGHCGLTDGIGSIDGYYRFARDFAFIDFVSLTDHDLWLTKPEWEAICRKAAEYDTPGRMVTYTGYEWTRHLSKGGHHNVIFRNFDGKMLGIRTTRSPEALFSGLADNCGPNNVLVIPHAHNPGDWRTHDLRVQRLVEIMSKHGSFEYYGRRFLENGYRLGLMAAGDDHIGHPGYPPVAGLEGGLMGVWADALDRDALFDAMMARRVYGTTGARIVLEFSVNGVPMGGDLEEHKGTRTYKAHVVGTGPILSVDLMGPEGVERTWRPGGEWDVDTATRLRVTFHSPTESPKSEGVMRPLKGQRWIGFVRFEGITPESIKPVGLERGGRYPMRKDDTEQAFGIESIELKGDVVEVVCVTRGDEDGFIVEIPEGAGRTLAFDFGGAKASVALADIAKDGAVVSLDDARVIRLAWLNDAPPNEMDLEWQDGNTQSEGDYQYLRVVQVDGQMAWSSPIWFGKE